MTVASMTPSTKITHGPVESKDVVVDGIPVRIAPSVSEETAIVSNQDKRLRRRGVPRRSLPTRTPHAASPLDLLD